MTTANRDVVMATAKVNGHKSVDCANTFPDDLEIQLLAARRKSATAALDVVHRLKALPNWMDKDLELDRAVDLLSVFAKGPNVNNALHDCVEEMIKYKFHPHNNKRGREEFERDFC